MMSHCTVLLLTWSAIQGNSIVEAARRKVMIDKFNEGAVGACARARPRGCGPADSLGPMARSGLSDELKKMCNMCHGEMLRKFFVFVIGLCAVCESEVCMRARR